MKSDGVPESMLAVVYRGINDLRLETLPVPRIGTHEMLVKVAVCGVCPTDIKKIHYGTVAPPRVFGHETAGTIAAVGSRVRGFRVGERVALHHHVPCMECDICRRGSYAQCEGYKRTGITAGFEPAGGGYAEYARVMPFVFPGIVRIPKRNSFAEGAMLEPVNTVLKAVRKLRVRKGDRVWVIGLGPIGLMFTALLSLQGCEVLGTDLLDARLKQARRWGARWTANAGDPKTPEALRRRSGARGLAAAVVCTPVDSAVLEALERVNGAGEIMLFAQTMRGKSTALDLSRICVDEKSLLGSYSSDISVQREVARVVFGRSLDVRGLISHAFPLEKTADAVALAAAPAPATLKVIVRHSKDE